jgi:hypothetical protein
VLLCNHLECRSLAVRQRNKLDGSKASGSKRCEAIKVSQLERRVSLGFGLVCVCSFCCGDGNENVGGGGGCDGCDGSGGGDDDGRRRRMRRRRRKRRWWWW